MAWTVVDYNYSTSVVAANAHLQPVSNANRHSFKLSRASLYTLPHSCSNLFIGTLMKKTLISLTLATLMTSGLASAMPSEGKVRADMGITESNLLAADQNRYTYKNMQEFMKTKNIDSGVMAPILLEQADKPLGDVEFTYDGKKMNLQGMLKDHRADAFIVLKDGKVVHEQYFDGQNQRTKHQMMSVTKSFTGILAATLVAEGKLDRDAWLKLLYQS